MNFLVDENVGNFVVRHLRNKKHNVIIASQKELLGREDSYLLGIAFKEESMVSPESPVIHPFIAK